MNNVTRLGAAMVSLQEWHRKYYKYTIHGGHNIQPGDEGHVELLAGGRKVRVSFSDLDVYGDDEVTHYGDEADAINEALRLWHADDSIKNFNVIVNSAIPPVSGEFSTWGKDGFMLRIKARNEASAREIAKLSFAVPISGLYVWEVH